VETVHLLDVGSRVTAFDKIAKTTIQGEIEQALNEADGVYWVRPETSVRSIPVDAWTVKPV